MALSFSFALSSSPLRGCSPGVAVLVVESSRVLADQAVLHDRLLAPVAPLGRVSVGDETIVTPGLPGIARHRQTQNLSGRKVTFAHCLLIKKNLDGVKQQK